MDHLVEMRALVAVAEEGSFIDAARRLKVTRPVISKRIAGLEKRLGVTLIHRTTRKVVLTDAGRIYFYRCRNILEQLHEADRQVVDTEEHGGGTLRIISPSSFGVHWLTPHAATFMRRHPETTLDIGLDDGYPDPTAGIADLIIRVDRLGQPGEHGMLLTAIPMTVA
ncbi:MAG: LysR family transcriptional regulator, partial [Magnetococcales bacterium]|nr:LysR family transcriptional regulator [Magnetococcales bacterium]